MATSIRPVVSLRSRPHSPCASPRLHRRSDDHTRGRRGHLRARVNRATALDHEVVHHPANHRAVVEPGADVARKLLTLIGAASGASVITSVPSTAAPLRRDVGAEGRPARGVEVDTCACCRRVSRRRHRAVQAVVALDAGLACVESHEQVAAAIGAGPVAVDQVPGTAVELAGGQLRRAIGDRRSTTASRRWWSTGTAHSPAARLRPPTTTAR